MARPRWQGGWIFQRGRKNPVWVGRFRKDYIADDGSRRRRQCSIVLGAVRDLGKREASRRLSERLAEINQGRHKPEVMLSFERFALERFEPNIYPTLRVSTANGYRWTIRAYLIPALGKLALPEIGTADVQVLLSSLSKRIAPRTVLSVRNRLRKMFGVAKSWGYIASNPADDVQLPALADVREKIVLSPEQMRRLLEELPEPHRTMALVAVLSGLRRGELFGLRWKSVNFAEGSILVCESNYHGEQSQPKTRASRRIVFVDAVVLEALRKIQPEVLDPNGYVFSSGRGTALNPENVRARVLYPACDRAGLPRVGWHSFRYTYATWGNATGENIKALQNQLGHTDPKVTLSVYTQPQPEAQRRLASKIAGVLLPLAPKSGDVGEVVVNEELPIQ
ncbi:MAG TPA: tyrosine-type recombinase/integrase [Candidatus Acidoferrales bacterium]|nr:tyrosine-type recombinase/integrase [Candidatus Acidoferrales bacterium]